MQKQRKPNRLAEYDYSQQGAYFITICIQNRHELLGEIVRTDNDCAMLNPSALGLCVIEETEKLTKIYAHVTLDCYVVMPNHIHLILLIDAPEKNDQHTIGQTEQKDIGRTQFAPTISRVIKQWKGSITKKIGFSPWQKSFHDRVIRNVEEYMRIHKYIENNPAQWEHDCFYVESQPVGANCVRPMERMNMLKEMLK